MPSSCKDIRAALAQCLAESPCIQAGNTAADCLREPLFSELPTRCQQLKKGYGDCKRGMIDMRKRFRGNKPIASTTGVADGGDSKYIGGVGDGMLYAGIGRKDTGSGRAGEVGYGAEEDASRNLDELVPGRFREESGGAGAYYSGYTPSPVSQDATDQRGKTEREGAGWSWWRGS